MILVKNYQLNTETVNVLNTLIDMDIKGKAAFRLMRIIKEISSLLEDRLKSEKKIYDKYVVLGEDGKPQPALDDNGEVIKNGIKVTDTSGFNAEMGDMMNVENVIQQEKINFDDLGLEYAKIKDLIKIDFIFE